MYTNFGARIYVAYAHEIHLIARFIPQGVDHRRH